jgi:hypothetical protein
VVRNYNDAPPICWDSRMESDRIDRKLNLSVSRTKDDLPTLASHRKDL